MSKFPPTSRNAEKTHQGFLPSTFWLATTFHLLIFLLEKQNSHVRLTEMVKFATEFFPNNLSHNISAQLTILFCEF